MTFEAAAAVPLALVAAEVDDAWDNAANQVASAAPSYALSASVPLGKYLHVLRGMAAGGVSRETFEKSLYTLLSLVKMWQNTLDAAHFGKLHAAAVTAVEEMLAAENAACKSDASVSQESFLQIIAEQLSLCE